MSLIKITNGKWIDPSRVKSVIALDESPPASSLGKARPARVMVDADKTKIVIECDDVAEAQAMANDLSALVNKEIGALPESTPIRDSIAIAALQGMLAHPDNDYAPFLDTKPIMMSREAYRLADTMLTVRFEQKPGAIL